MTEPRRVRPGELPQFGQVRSWHPNGPKYLALGLVPVDETRGTRYNLVGLQLLATPNRIDNTMRWSAPAQVGIGPILVDWYIHDEDENTEADDIADSDGRLAPAGLR